MHKKVTDFFKHYAVAMQDRQLKLLKSIYQLPFIIVHDEPERVVSLDEELESNLLKVLDSLDQREISNIDVMVKKAIHLSNDVHFANVNWTFKNQQDEVQLTYNTSYMLSIIEDNIKVMTVIIDDENDTNLQLLN